MTRLITIVAALVLALLLALTWILTLGRDTEDALADCRQGQVAGGAAQIGGPFTLVDETGTTVTDTQVIDRPALIYFGYAFCPDVCPLDLARNAEAVDLLAERGMSVKPVFISIDPERDTPAYLAEYTDYLHPEMLGLTGTPDQVRAASQAYRTFYSKQDAEDGDPDYYLMNHTTLSYLVTPEDGFLEFYRQDATAEQVADSVQCFLEAR